MGQNLLPEGAAPSTPAAGYVSVYAKADGLIYAKDDAGVETLVSGSAALAGSASQAFEGSTLKAATTIGVGAATPAASGAGITFPATQSASSDANTLDDYEEGTFTPNVGGNTTYSLQLGHYTKLGDLVTIDIAMAITTLGTGSTTVLSGLPFASANNNQLSLGMSQSANLATAVVSEGVYVTSNTSTLSIHGRTAAGVSATAPITAFGNGTAFRCSVAYRV